MSAAGENLAAEAGVGRASFRAWFKAGNPEADPLETGLTFAVTLTLLAWSGPVWHALNQMVFSVLAHPDGAPRGLAGLQAMIGALLTMTFLTMSRARSWRSWLRACLTTVTLCILFGLLAPVMHWVLDLPDPRALEDLPAGARRAAVAKTFIVYPALYLAGMAVSTVAPWWLDGRLPPGGAEQPPRKEWLLAAGIFSALPLSVGLMTLDLVASNGQCGIVFGPIVLGMWYPVSAAASMEIVWRRRPDLRWAMATRLGAGLLMLAGGVLLAQFTRGCPEPGVGSMSGNMSWAAALGPGLPIHLAAFLLAHWVLHVFLARHGLLPRDHVAAHEAEPPP